MRIAAEREADAATKLRFGAVVAEFVERYAKPRNRTWPETERLLTKADLAPWQDRDLRSITRQEILAVLDRMVERGAPIQANRLVAALRRFFGWAVERGLLDASPVASLKPPSAEAHRDRVLSDEELRAIWLAADEIGYPFGPAVQLMILTGQRRSEVLEAEWREFDLERGLWSIPRERAKNDTGHVVPLCAHAVELIRSLPRIGTPPRTSYSPRMAPRPSRACRRRLSGSPATAGKHMSSDTADSRHGGCTTCGVRSRPAVPGWEYPCMWWRSA